MLKKSVTVCCEPEGPSLLFISDRTFRLRLAAERYSRAVKQLQTGTTTAALAEILDPLAVERLLRVLDEKGLLRPLFQNQFVGTRYEKQVEFLSEFIDDPNAAQEALLRSVVCVVGCGGTGGVAVQHLLGAGVRNYVCIEPDTVAVTNFNRQFLPEWQDCGRPKAEAVRKYVLSRAPEAQIVTHTRKILAAADLHKILAARRPDVVLCCADIPPIQIQIAVMEYCLTKGVPCTFAAVGVHSGSFGPLLVGQEPARKYLDYLRRQLKRFRTDDLSVVSASSGVTNSLTALLMTADVVLYLSGVHRLRSLNTSVLYRFADQTSEVVHTW